MKNKTKFCPFIDVSVNAAWDDWQNYPDGRPNPAYSAAAIKYKMDMLFLGFLTADVNGNAAWSAQEKMPVAWAQPLSKELSDGGVKVSVSFGGAANHDISYVQSVNELVVTYQQVIGQLNASHLDFDFENGLYNEDRAFSALAIIKEKHPDLTLSLTLPTMPTGLTGVGLSLVKKSVDSGLAMKVNGMAMDYFSPDYTDMGAAAVMAANSIKNQLAGYYPSLSEDELYDLVQITPMIGVNDDQTMFTFDDVDVITGHAKNVGLNLVSMWSLNRDKPGDSPWADAGSSGNPEQTKEFEYSERFINGLK